MEGGKSHQRRVFNLKIVAVWLCCFKVFSFLHFFFFFPRVDDMDSPKKRAKKWTRYQYRKAEEELLEKARFLKKKRDRAKRNATTKSNGKDGDNSSDVILNEEDINDEQGTKIVNQQEDMDIDLNLIPSSENGSNLGTRNPVTAPSLSDSESISNSDDDVVFLRVEYHNQGIQQEGIGDESDQSESHGSRNQNLKTSGDDIVLISESTSEENDTDTDSDDDFSGEESVQTESFESLYDSDSDYDPRYSDKGKRGTTRNKDDDITKPVKRDLDWKKVWYEDEATSRNRNTNHEMEDDDDNDYGSTPSKDINLVSKKRKSESVHKKSVKKTRVIIENDELGESSLQRRVKPCHGSGSDSGKTRLCSSEKPSPATRFSVVDNSNERDNFVEKSSKRSRISSLKKSKSKNHRLKDIDFLDMLSDSILQEGGDTLQDKLPCTEVEDQIENRILPLKFRFMDDDPIQVEKDELQKEIESLFADLELGWIEEDIESTKLSKEDKDAAVTDPVENCRLGNHSLIFDETIGFICKYCRIVQEEIQHCLPALKIRTKKRNEWLDFYKDEVSLSNFQFDADSPSEYNRSFSDAEGPVLNIIPPYLRRQMYPHQLDGFQFLWNKIAGTNLIEDLKTSLLDDGGTGCIISHAPGTGKSFLTIVFLLTFMEVYPTCHPVIMAPVSMLHAWATEVKRWKVNIPFYNLQDSELSEEEKSMADQQWGSSIRDQKLDKHCKRMIKLHLWKKSRSILGLGYKLFGKLAGEGEQSKGNQAGEKLRKFLLEFPGILILDEGHTARNENSMLWKTLTKVQTGRRVILSGTPFQNNHTELYNILCLVNPNFAKEKLGKNDNQATEQLKAMMAPFVHVHKGNVLQERLPGLRDTLVVLNPTELQKQLVNRIHVPKNNSKENQKYLEQVRRVSLVSVHPSLVSQLEEFSDQKTILEEQEMNPELGVKTQFVIKIVQLSDARNEKVLVFSEFIPPLNYLLKQLTSSFSWEEGKQVLYMDGKLGDKQRQTVISSLNAQNTEAKVLLASIKACSEGINLVGASRVVLLDAVWNPSFQRQAICRAYRLGQKKMVYVYHLISTKTEIDKYLKQAKKDRLSEQLFPTSDGVHNHKSKLSGSSITGDDDILDRMVHSKKLGHIFHTILPRSKESNVFGSFDFVFSAEEQI